MKKNCIYFKSEGRIFKYDPETNIYLLCTPWKKNEDRRFSEILEHNRISKNKALEEINAQWKNHKDVWTWQGKKYEARGDVFTGTHIEKYKVLDIYIRERKVFDGLFEMCPKHEFTMTFKDGHFYTETYYLVMYHGKLIWVQNSQYIPRVYYYPFESIDKDPSLHKFGGWTTIKCLKPIYCVTDKKYI